MNVLMAFSQLNFLVIGGTVVLTTAHLSYLSEPLVGKSWGRKIKTFEPAFNKAPNNSDLACINDQNRAPWGPKTPKKMTK